MFKEIFGSALGLAVGASLISIGLFASAAFAARLDVNCNAQGSAAVQDAIDNASVGDEIVVVGNCTGTSLVISTDRLTLLGQGSAKLTGDGVTPAITVTAAQVTIEGWNLIDGGADHGIVVRAAGSAFVRDVSIIAGVDGIQVTESSSVEVDNVVIQVTDDGIFAVSNGDAVVRNTDISGNPDDAVVAASGGSVRLAGGNTIENNGDFGVIVRAGQVRIDGTNTVQGNRVDLDCSDFARVIIFQSITSSTDILRSPDCEVVEAFGAAVFENNPQNLVICDEGETITQALNNEVTDIVVRGLCDEFVTITTSNVTIRGENQSPIGRPVDGILTGLGPGIGRNVVAVTGAQNVNLINLTLTGGRNAVLINRGAAASITTSDIAPDGAGRFGLVVADNAFANLNDTFVSAGSQGGTVLSRNGTIRMFRSSSSGGATDKFALILNNSVAYIYGSGFTGGLSAHFNSRISFLEEFLGTFYGDSSISATVVPPIQCSRYSNVTAFPGGIVQGMFGPLTNADVFAFDDCRATIE